MGLTDLLGDSFVPASKLSELRRAIVYALDSAISINHKYVYRKKVEVIDKKLEGVKLTYHDNISNSLAEEFYALSGASIMGKAIEIDKPIRLSEIKVMTTRYCLRRELECCLKVNKNMVLPSVLYLVNGNNK